MAGDLGATIQLSYAKDLNRTSALFSESTTRFLVEVAPHQVAPFQEALGSHPVTRLGEVQAASRLQISDMNGDSLVDLSIDSIRDAFNGSFQG
jgi:phosphoribosylformylglycinamidine synthase